MMNISPPASTRFGAARMNSLRTVLIIDDDPNIRETLQIVLEGRGYQVLSATNGEAGIAKALKERPHLIIVDMMMPKASGFVVTERLKQQHQLSIPIIMLTANESDHQRAYAEFLGVDAYLNKPVPTQELSVVLQQLCPIPPAVPLVPEDLELLVGSGF